MTRETEKICPLLTAANLLKTAFAATAKAHLIRCEEDKCGAYHLCTRKA